MTPDDRELRRALEARSGEPSTEFHARLTAAFDEGRPTSGLMQAVAVVTVVAITLGTVGVLLLSRNARNVAHQGAASASRFATPSPGISQEPPIPMPNTAQLSAPSSNVVWVRVANTALFRSTDKGATWDKRSLPGVAAGGWMQVSFIDDRQGWLLHPGVPGTQCSGAGAEIWRTSDGAATWERVAYVDQQNQTSGLGFAQCKEQISFVDATHGYVGASDGNNSPTIYRTADGGKTWSGSTLPDPPDFKTSGGFALQAWLVKRFGDMLYVEASGKQGGDIPDRQYVFRSTDGGATWSWLLKIPSRYIAMVTESRWLQLIWPGQSMESTNGGQQWHPYASDFNTDTPVGGPQIVFADSQVGYAEGRGALQRTVDGGAHWERIATPGTASTTSCSPKAGGVTPSAGWLTYSSPRGGYSVDYPATWCDLPNFGAPDTEKYFSNESAGSLYGMTRKGILGGITVSAGACPAPGEFREIYEQATLKVAGQDVKRTYGYFGGLEVAVMIQAAIPHGGNCYTFNFITQTRQTGDQYLSTADRMITSLKFT
jgi:photosystem II stability/assembly factor-like uncharacterized protein